MKTPSADLFKLAFDSSPTGKLVIDGSGAIILANREAERLFGYGRGRIAGAVGRSARAGALPVRAFGRAPRLPGGTAVAPHGRRPRPVRAAEGRHRTAHRDRSQPGPHARRRDHPHDHRRHQRAPDPRGPAAPGPEARGHRHARRRHRARLQQPAAQHHRLLGTGDRRRHRSAGARRPGAGARGGGARPGTGAPDARVQPPERLGQGRRGAASAHARSGGPAAFHHPVPDRDPVSPRRRGADGARRSDAGPAGADEPRDQRRAGDRRCHRQHRGGAHRVPGRRRLRAGAPVDEQGPLRAPLGDRLGRRA